jgi:hypothetical protein
LVDVRQKTLLFTVVSVLTNEIFTISNIIIVCEDTDYGI